MKVNTQRVNNMCKTMNWFLVAILFSACSHSASTKMMTEDYPALYEAIYERDAESIFPFTWHTYEAVSRQAWRALISTSVENNYALIDQAMQANTDEAWAALSLKKLTDEQLESLMDSWSRTTSLRGGISQVLGQQGNEESLRFLARNFDKIIFSNYEEEAALAIGRLIARHPISTSNQDMILHHAAIQEDPQIVRSYFYGHYRSGKEIENNRTKKIIWETYLLSDDPLIKQYMLKITLQSDVEAAFQKLDVSEVQNMNVQLAIELAQFLDEILWTEKLQDVIEKLLEHENPVVNEVVLNQVMNHPEKPVAFDEITISKIVENQEKEASVRLSGIEALASPENHLELVDSLSNNNEYLLIKKLNIYKDVLTADEFLDEIETYTESENRMEVLFATQAISGWWASLPETNKTTDRTQRVRNILLGVLDAGDRSITYSAGDLLSAPGLINNNDYSQFEEILSKFQLPEDVEVYQAFGSFFKERFEEQAKPLIDSLAVQGNIALNNTFASQGWEIPEVEGQTESFRKPDWNRLLELGFNPVWVLETEKGVIKIEMDVLSAPATIAGMDSLISAGEYDDVAFHRVVPNFVVQGGDVETGDGFGGPDYVVPTEASEKQYYRGKVGIASAGTDTEGSQYFFMHQWAPHLNGRYTIVGEVIEGMEVVDRMMVGDKVVKAYWE